MHEVPVSGLLPIDFEFMKFAKVKPALGAKHVRITEPAKLNTYAEHQSDPGQVVEVQLAAISKV